MSETRIQEFRYLVTTAGVEVLGKNGPGLPRTEVTKYPPTTYLIEIGTRLQFKT